MSFNTTLANNVKIWHELRIHIYAAKIKMLETIYR